MTDYCLKNTNEAEFNKLMLNTGLCVETEDGIAPASCEVIIDQIGPITMGDITYPEYYSNLRLLVPPTEKQDAQLAIFAIDPNSPQYRVWA